MPDTENCGRIPRKIPKTRSAEVVVGGEIVRFILTTLPILADSSTSCPEGQVRYVRDTCVCAYRVVEVLQYDCYMPACFDH